MTIQRMDHVGIVVDDLAAATTFFLEMGLELRGEITLEGAWMDRIVGLEGVRAELAVVQTSDGQGRLELTKFHSPPEQAGDGHAPANAHGIRHVAFAVEDIDAVVSRVQACGAEFVGELERYEDTYRICYLRGPEGIIVELAERDRLTPAVRLADIDLSRRLDRSQEEHHLRRAGERLLACQLALSGRTAAIERPPAIVVVLEGMDGAGKGGAIRCLVAPLDPRHVRVVSYAEPTEEELTRPYLWRFWRDVPPRGGMLACDRSWYGRVLVERVEGLARRRDWRRAYGEINRWERYLVDNDVVLVKLWLHISREEQLRRFEKRAADRQKRWKLTAADWRARERWDGYAAAAQEMIDRTSTSRAPWIAVAADDKPHARVTVVRATAEAIGGALEARGVTPPPLRDIPPVLE